MTLFIMTTMNKNMYLMKKEQFVLTRGIYMYRAQFAMPKIIMVRQTVLQKMEGQFFYAKNQRNLC